MSSLFSTLTSPPFPGLCPHPTLSGKYKMLKVWISLERENQNKNKLHHILIVQLHHPAKRNAINSQMWKEIGSIFHDEIPYLEETDLRCIILTGSPKCFTAGIDWSDTKLFPSTTTTISQKSSRMVDPARKGLSFLPQIRDMQHCFSSIEKCPVPVICGIDGYCIGAGIDLACCCDIRLCTLQSVFSVREVKIGLAADIGTLQRLPNITGNDSLVRQYCYTGDNFDASTAKQMGLVSSSRVLCDSWEALMKESTRIATRIASNSPVAVVGTKSSLIYSRDHSVQEGLEHVAAHNALALMTQDIPVSIMAAQSKDTAPQFQGMPAYSKL
ncbi:MAG: hypothetical protein SGILL_005329 [Bacillariaceae sp.]